MEINLVNTFAATAAGVVPARTAPTRDLVQGRGVPAAGRVAFVVGGDRPRIATEPDSVMEALPV
jgi:hypothetical protein